MSNLHFQNEHGLHICEEYYFWVILTVSMLQGCPKPEEISWFLELQQNPVPL